MFKFINNKKRIKYFLAPQTKFYDAMPAKWRPFVMFNQFSNIRSKFCNTDIHGLRFNELKDQNAETSIFEQYQDSKKNEALIVGNSLSFGEGQTQDNKTISNLLSQDTKYNFYNLSGRGFSGLQEIMNFLIFKKKIKKLKKIIIISGLNDSILPFFINKFDEYQTPIFGYDRFTKVMSNASRGWKNNILKFFFNKLINKTDEVWEKTNSQNWRDELFGKGYQLNKKKDKLNPMENMRAIIERNIEMWSIIGRGMNIQVEFVLQPVGSWCKAKKTEEEEKIFFEEDKIPSLHKVYKHVDKDKYKEVKKLFVDNTNKNSISFVDLNEIFDNSEYSDKWLFTSKFHLTDLGSKIVAKSLANKLL
jgi:hypothetical protein